MDTYRQQIQLPQSGPAFFAWPPGEPQTRADAKRKLEPDANEVVERLNGFVLSPNSLKKLRTGEAVDVSTAPTLMGSSLPQQQFDAAALEIDVDPGQSGEDAQQRPFMVQLPSPSSPDGSPPRGTQNAIIPYPTGVIFPGSTVFQPPAATFGGNSDLMQALDLKGRGGAEASAALDIPRRLVRNNSCSSLPRSLFFDFSGGESTATEMEEDSDDDPNSKAVIPWAPPPFVLQGILGASRPRADQPKEEEMEDAGGLS